MGAAMVGGIGPGPAAAGPDDAVPATQAVPATLVVPATAELGRALTQVMRAVSRAKDLARSDGGHPETATFPLLVALVEAGSMRASDLAQAVLSDRSTVSRQVAHLVELGYVERRPDPADRRAYHLVLTEAGARALDAHCRARDEHLARLTRTWPEVDRRALARLLERLAGELTHELRQGDSRVAPRRPTHPQEGA